MPELVTNNRLQHVRVDLKLTTTSGYQSATSFADAGSKAAKAALDELARILALDGEGDAALTIVAEAVQRVADYHKSQEPHPIPPPEAPDSNGLLTWCSEVEQCLVSVHGLGPEAAKNVVDGDAGRLSEWHSEGKSALDAANEVATQMLAGAERS
ncbi:hypothetical protein [Cupriavidus sp. TMH.W2]|uniref:hypothetical protein n=1 Tax=Cupriavidus sp. TMH.W2 TaxID=3434465 RepID=UPI003D76B6C7